MGECYVPVSEVASSGSTRRVCGCGCDVPVREVASSGSTRRCMGVGVTYL